MIRYATFLGLVAAVSLIGAASEKQPAEPISFARDIAPLLQRNCLACHREGQAEGGLSLESATAIETGGDSGELVDIKQPSDSLLLTRITDPDEIMPPDDNSVGAKRLTAPEVDLVRRWIESGAKIDRMVDDSADWEPIPESIRTSLSMAFSPDSQSLAVAHANRVDVVAAPALSESTSLVDSGLQQSGVASVDFVASIAYSPTGMQLATGGFKTVRIWNRVAGTATPWQWAMPIAGMSVLSPDAKNIAFIDSVGDVQVWSIEQQQYVATFSIPQKATLVNWNCDQQLVIIDRAQTLRLFDVAQRAETSSSLLSSNADSLDQSSDGQWVAVVASSGKIQAYSKGQPVEMNSLAAIQDAAVVKFASPTELLVGTKGGSVQQIDLSSDSVVRTISAEFSVSAIGFDTDRLLVGSANGQAKAFKRGDGSLLSTTAGDWEMQLARAGLQRELKQQTNWTDGLKKQSESLQANVDKEKKSLEESSKAHAEAKQKVDENRKKRDDSNAQLAAAKTAVAKSEESKKVANTESVQLAKDVAELEQQSVAMKQSMMPLQQSVDQANKVVSDAEAKLAEAMKELQTAKEQAVAETAKLQAAQKAYEQKEERKQESKAKLETVNKQLADLEKSIADQNKQIEQVGKTLAEQEKALTQSEQTLANRLQALEATKEAHKIASDRIPEHQREILVRSLRVENLQASIDSIDQQRLQSEPVVSVQISADGKSFDLLDRGGQLRQFDLSTGRAVGPATDTGLTDVSETAELGMIDDTICIVGDFQPRSIKVPEQWKLHAVVGGLQSELISDRVMSIAFSPDGNSIAFGSGVPSRSGMISIADAKTGEVVREFQGVHSDVVLALRFSPSGDLLASGSADKSIRLIDFRKGAIVKSLDGHTHHVMALDWQHDGRVLASGGADKNIKVWDVLSGQQKRNIGALSEELTSVRFIGETSKVVSATLDGQIRIHETTNGAQASATGAGDLVYCLDVSPDAQFVSAAGQRGEVKMWNVEGLKPIQASTSAQ